MSPRSFYTSNAALFPLIFALGCPAASFDTLSLSPLSPRRHHRQPNTNSMPNAIDSARHHEIVSITLDDGTKMLMEQEVSVHRSRSAARKHAPGKKQQFTALEFLVRGKERGIIAMNRIAQERSTYSACTCSQNTQKYVRTFHLDVPSLTLAAEAYGITEADLEKFKEPVRNEEDLERVILLLLNCNHPDLAKRAAARIILPLVLFRDEPRYKHLYSAWQKDFYQGTWNIVADYYNGYRLSDLEIDTKLPLTIKQILQSCPYFGWNSQNGYQKMYELVEREQLDANGIFEYYHQWDLNTLKASEWITGYDPRYSSHKHQAKDIRYLYRDRLASDFHNTHTMHIIRACTMGDIATAECIIDTQYRIHSETCSTWKCANKLRSAQISVMKACLEHYCTPDRILKLVEALPSWHALSEAERKSIRDRAKKSTDDVSRFNEQVLLSCQAQYYAQHPAADSSSLQPLAVEETMLEQPIATEETNTYELASGDPQNESQPITQTPPPASAPSGPDPDHESDTEAEQNRAKSESCQSKAEKTYDTVEELIEAGAPYDRKKSGRLGSIRGNNQTILQNFAEKYGGTIKNIEGKLRLVTDCINVTLYTSTTTKLPTFAIKHAGKIFKIRCTQ